jgi:hypothetical protein
MVSKSMPLLEGKGDYLHRRRVRADESEDLDQKNLRDLPKALKCREC